MDDADKRILRAIQTHPDATMRELGDMTGLTHTPCWRRLKRLREDGYITEKRYVLDAQKLGYEIVAFCMVQLKTHTRDSLESFEDGARRIPEVVQCYSAAGDHDYILRVLAKSVRDYEDTIKHKILQLPNVTAVKTNLTLREIKNTPDVPI
ncbi:MAG: Lrp/AsnC family transcriptional regulator [Pseudomonadota bacterium]